MFKDKYISTRNTWNVLLWTKICLLVPSAFIKISTKFAHDEVFISFAPPTCPQVASNWNGAGQTQCWSSSNSVWNALFYPLPYPHRTLCPKDPPHATVRHVRMVAYLAHTHGGCYTPPHLTRCALMRRAPHFIPHLGREPHDHKLFLAYSKIRPTGITLIPTFQFKIWAKPVRQFTNS